MKKLVGLRVDKIFVGGYEEDSMWFVTDNRTIRFTLDGDCCSVSWFADITGVSALLGNVVSRVEEVSMDGYNVDDGRCRQEKDLAYGYRIYTNKGVCEIVFRNSSNGCYGGSCDTGTIKTVAVPSDAVEILDDWHA